MKWNYSMKEYLDILDVKYNSGATIGYVLPPRIYEITDFISMINPSIPDEVKVNITIDDIRLRAGLTSTKFINFSLKSFLKTILGFTQSQFGSLVHYGGFIQLGPGSYKSDKPINITGVDKKSFKL